VDPPVAGGAAPLLDPADELRSAALEQRQALLGWQDLAERDPHRELTVVGDVGVGEQLDEPLPPGVGDAVDLLAPGAPPARGGTPLGPERRQLTHQRAAHRRAGRAGGAGDGLDVAGPLQPPEGGVERAERDGEAQAAQVAETLAQLVAVEVALDEEAEDGEVEHRWPIAGGAVVRGCARTEDSERSYRHLISIRYIAQP